MGILEGRRVLVTGVTTDSSIGFAVAREAQQQGASVVLSNAGRALRITRRVASWLPTEPEVLELDVTDPDHLDSLAERLAGVGFGSLHGVVHAIAHADDSLMGGDLLRGRWEEVSAALHVSAYSLPALVRATRGILEPGAGVVGLTLDSSVAWPTYDWMGVAKAALEASARYLARDLGPAGVRVNLVAAGPLRTPAAGAVPGFEELAEAWDDQAPLGWARDDATPVARSVVALLSDFFPATTGEIVHVDGGHHATGP